MSVWKKWLVFCGEASELRDWRGEAAQPRVRSLPGVLTPLTDQPRAPAFHP